MRRRLILLVPLLALFAFVAKTEERAEAADPRVEGENFTNPPTGTYDVITGAGYSGGAALRFKADGSARYTVNCSARCDVVLMASGGQNGGQASLSVNGSTQQALTSNTTTAYTFDDVNLPAGESTFSVKAGGTGTGHNAILDVATFPADGGGTPPQCSDTLDNDGDGKIDFGGTNGDPGCSSATDNDERNAPPPTWDCTGNNITHIRPGDDIDNAINQDDSRATTFCVHEGRYPVSAPAILKDGDKLMGEPGSTIPIDTATIEPRIDVPIPKVKLEGSGSDNLLRARGRNITISWVDLSGASGTGNGSGAITAGSADSTFLVEHSRIHNNASAGITNMKGTVSHSEFFSNSQVKSSLGFNGSAVKGITEYEADHVYVHDEQGNGIWCDVGCSDDSARTNGFWVHDSVVVNSGRGGIRYENSSNQALFENNEVHGNGIDNFRGGIDIRDSQHATVGPGNIFGTATITVPDEDRPGQVKVVNYKVNGDRIGVRATDSGRSDRVNLSEVVVVGNDLNNDRIVPWPCAGQVMCSGNTRVGTK